VPHSLHSLSRPVPLFSLPLSFAPLADQKALSRTPCPLSDALPSLSRPFNLFSSSPSLAPLQIEMERYIDMAYQRDGEEMKNWAFCTLGGGSETPQFYPAEQFKLYGRNALGFSEDLGISVNHYDPTWVGQRRLKNACIALEWIPEIAKLCPKKAKTTPLSEASNLRLEKALALLDIDDSGSFDIPELIEVLRSAEDVDLTDAELDELLFESQNADGKLVQAPSSVYIYIHI